MEDSRVISCLLNYAHNQNYTLGRATGVTGHDQNMTILGGGGPGQSTHAMKVLFFQWNLN